MIIDKIYDFLIIHLIEPLSKLHNFPNIIQGIGLALLTILIPLAIAVLADIYQKRKDEEKDFVYLDLHVILDNVFNIKLLILSVFLIFLPMLFWEVLIGLDRLIAIHFIFIGIILVVDIVFKISRWVKGNVFDFRFSYLEKLKKYNNLEIVWKSVWQVKNINIQNERKFFQIFSFTITRLLSLAEKSENLKTISKLLNDFYNYINHHSMAALNEDILSKILNWYFNFWQKENEFSDKNFLDKKAKLDKWSSYGEILRTLEDIFSNIEERSFKGGIIYSYSFFTHFKRHVEYYKDELVERNNTYHYYIDSVFDVFCRVFFRNIEKSSKKYDIWEHYFPEEWKAKSSNFEKNVISKSLCRKFLTWVRDIVLDDKKEFARDLGNISSNLFSEVEPSLWISILLLFVFSHYGDNRMKMESIIKIEHSWDFGFIGRVRIGDNEKSLEKQVEVEVKNTFELTFRLFKKQFSKYNLQKYIEALKELELEYKKDSDKEKKRLRLLDAFSKMLKFLDN